MRYAQPDDTLFHFDNSDSGELSGEDIADLVSGFVNQPSIDEELSGLGEELALLGYAADDQLLGSMLSEFIKKITGAAKKQGINLTANVGGGTLSFNKDGTPDASAPVPAADTSASSMLKNPVVLIGGAAALGLLVLVLVKRKRR